MSIKRVTIFYWALRILAAVIMLQTLFFKFSGAEESVYIFSKLGMEPWGRIGTGIIELIASIMLLVPRTTAVGALLGLGVMSGALFFHLTRLGIVVQDDHGQLFIYALLVFISCAVLVWSFRRQLFAFFSPGLNDHF
ncbi:MAG TPA: DoxX family protein [Puia sp.]|nr:DoxX family protein [Puia sp.]